MKSFPIRKSGTLVLIYHQAEIKSHFCDFDEAERLYLSTDRFDLAIDFRRRLGDWFRVAQLAKESRSVMKDSELIDVWKALGDYYYDKARWSQASEFYRQGGDFKKVVRCLSRTEDYSSLEILIDELPDSSPLLPEIARILSFAGLSAPASRALTKVRSLALN